MLSTRIQPAALVRALLLVVLLVFASSPALASTTYPPPVGDADVVDDDVLVPSTEPEVVAPGGSLDGGRQAAPASALPVTGSQVLVLLGAGLALLVVGGALTRVARRR